MYISSKNQLSFKDFILPFGGKLDGKNRWVILASLVPWDDLEPLYVESLTGSHTGAPAKSFRVALGALIIKERLGTSDEETVEQIRENPYLQYFLGFSTYSNEAIFEASMFVHFRKRISKEILDKLNILLSKNVLEKNRSKKTSKKVDDKRDSGSNDKVSVNNKGKLLVDATCAPSDITYPTDLKLLNTAREKSEEIIDLMYSKTEKDFKKPRTYRNKARKEYLLASKNKKLTKKKARKANKKQLNFLKRNLNTISKLINVVGLNMLSKRKYKNLLVISEVYRQQEELLRENKSNIKSRVVNIYQEYVRPIMRGKAACRTEFGAKLSVAYIDGFCFLDHLSWEAYNEGVLLEKHIEKYKERVGNYPESVHVDKIYVTRVNRKYCNERGIRLSGPPLGRPSKEVSKETSSIRRKDEIDRIAIESKFGQGKRRYGLNHIKTKLSETSEISIHMTFVVMNLDMLVKNISLKYFFQFFELLKFYYLKIFLYYNNIISI